MKNYKKYSARDFANHTVYFFILVLISVAISTSNIESHLTMRVILLGYSLFVVFFKQYDGLREIFVGEVKSSLLNIVFSVIKAGTVLLLEAVVMYLFLVFVLYKKWPEIFTNEVSECIWAFTLIFTSSLLSLFIVYEFVKSLLHFMNAYASIYYSKMIKRERIISLFGDDIIEIRYETRENETEWAIPAVILCAIVAVIIELVLIRTIPFYWS